MALTREFKETIGARIERDPRFREALFTEAMNAYLGGDIKAGKALLRDLVNATIGFEELASVLKSRVRAYIACWHRMGIRKPKTSSESSRHSRRKRVSSSR